LRQNIFLITCDDFMDKMRVASYGLRVTGCELRVASYGLRVAGYGLRVTGYGLRVTSCELRVAGYGLRVTGCPAFSWISASLQLALVSGYWILAKVKLRFSIIKDVLAVFNYLLIDWKLFNNL
jgi:hypothetical protein